MDTYGSYPCPACGSAITAWRGDPRTGRLFDADPYNPYRPHICDTTALQLRRIADQLAAAVAHMDGVPGERNTRHERALPAAAAAPAHAARTSSGAAPARPAASSPNGRQPVAVGAAPRGDGAGPARTNGVTVEL